MKRIKLKKINLGSSLMVFLFIIFFLGIALIYKYGCMSEKNFISANYILELMGQNKSHNLLRNGWTTTATFFNFFNLFRIQSLFGWSIFIIVFFLAFIWKALGKKIADNFYVLSIDQFIYLCSVLFLLGVYVLCISKDLLQFLMFGCLNLIIYSNFLKSIKLKLILSIVVFSLLSTVFKPYYILFGVYTGYIYLLFNFVAKWNKRRKEKKVIIAIIFTLGAVFVCMLLVHFIYPSGYNELLRARSGSMEILVANTEISDVISSNGNNLFIWFINYLVGLLRMLIPIELLVKKISYTPFVIYQLLMTNCIINSIKQLNINNKKLLLTIAIMVSFVIVSGLFEPDFGSWVRHGTTTFFLLNNLVFLNKNDKEMIVDEDLQ